MPHTITSIDIPQLLQTTRTIAVVGCSPRPERDSHEVAQYLQAQGYRIVPVNPVVAASAAPQILGERCYASLHEAMQALPAGQRFDVVDVFRNSAEVPPVVDEAIAVGAGMLWLQLGVAHAPAAAKAQAAGLGVVQNRCIKLDHMAWLAQG
jgi:uncharacterized protein